MRKPVDGDVDMSSPFGMRLDPFLGRPAIHTGVDLRGEIGEPARATATGKVTIAGWDGGYGNMVEIDHGNGLATRYGHLSKILVKVGQFVRIGETVGLIGSTGRSTGPHLHYETRINGEAVDPQKFLRAGIRLGSLSRPVGGNQPDLRIAERRADAVEIRPRALRAVLQRGLIASRSGPRRAGRLRR